MNELQRATKLLIEYNIEQEKRNSQQLAMSNNHDILLDDYDKLHDDFTSLETTLALNKLNAKSLTQQVADLQASYTALEGVNEYLSGQNKKLEEYAGYKRKYEVAIADLARAKEQVKRVKSKAPTKVRKDKKSVSYDRLNEAYQTSQRNVNELLAYGQSSPQFMGGLKHSTQGVMDFVDLKPETMGIKDGDGDEVEMMVQRVVVINRHNSCKMMTRIIGQAGLHTVKVPKGGIVQLDDEGKKHINEYFVDYDKHYGEAK